MKPGLALAALAGLMLVPHVAAHAEPFASQPASGARLDSSPDIAWVDFTEPVFRDGSWIRVLDGDGQRVDNDDLQITGKDRPRMEVTVPTLPDGAYRIAWQTYSQSDGHTIRGTIGFAVGGFAPPETTTDPEADLDGASAMGRAVTYVGFTLAIGAMAYRFFVRKGDVMVAWPHMAAGGVAAAIGSAIILVDTAAGTGLGVAAYSQTPGGRALTLRVVAAVMLAALAAVAGPKGRSAPWLAGGWLLLAIEVARFGHITQKGTWAIGLELIHLLAASIWVGSLVHFVLAMPRLESNQALRQEGLRFSRLAVWSVAAVAATGLIITFGLVGTHLLDAAAWSDSWTWFLATKVSLVVLMLALAALNRFVFLESSGNMLWRVVAPLRPDWRLAEGRGRSAFRKVVGVEAGLGLATIVMAGLLLSVSPPADAGLAEADSLERTGQGGTYLALMRVTPLPEAGQSHTLRFFISEEETGEPLTNNSCGRDDCVRVRWSLEGDPGSEQAADLVPEGDGWWRVEDVLFVATGPTTVSIDIQSAYVYLDVIDFEAFAVE